VRIFHNIYETLIYNPFVTVGVFDGVHLGHQSIFKKLIEIAHNNNGESVVFSFWPHPKMVIGNDTSNLQMIYSYDEKVQLIKETGIENLIVVPFTKEFSQFSSEAFIEHYLFNSLKIKGLIVGFDHKFGKDQEGSFEILEKYSVKYNFMLKRVEAFTIDNVNVSSTIIRSALKNGEIERANLYLSRNFTLAGTVTYGKKIGNTLGFPTANIEPDFEYKIIPCNGVYAVKARIGVLEYPGMLNIGYRPTFNHRNESKTIEVHIIGFEGYLYQKKIELTFYTRIRNEIKFDTIDMLISQLQRDKLQVSNYFLKAKSIEI